MPEVYGEFQRIGQQLEKHYRDVQDLEFTIERGRLYMLQTRDAKRTAAAAVKIAVDMVDEGVDHQGRRPSAGIEPGAGRPAPARPVRPGGAQGRAARSPRASTPRRAPPSGRAVFDADDAVEWVGRGEKVILVRIETSPDDFHGMAVAEGILTARGGATSHAAVVARQIGKPCVAGLAPSWSSTTRAKKAALHRSPAPSFKEGDWISLDGSTGELFLGQLPTVQRPVRGPARAADSSSAGPTRSGAWASGPTPTSPRRPPRPAATARRASACAGPSTCSARASGSRSSAARSSSPTRRPAPRPSRAPARRSTPTSSEAVATFDAAMAKLEVLQQGDFEGIFRAMDGLPVVIRLIDPPLHEFLPNLEEQLVKVTRAEDARRRVRGGPASCSAAIQSMHEQNPMLGLRGCRLGLMIPDFVKIQTRAILNAADRGQARPAATRSPRS